MLIRVRAPTLDVFHFQLFPIYVLGDMWETFPGTFQDFSFEMFKVDLFENCRT